MIHFAMLATAWTVLAYTSFLSHFCACWLSQKFCQESNLTLYFDKVPRCKFNLTKSSHLYDSIYFTIVL